MYEAIRERSPHLKGVGGWLAFLVVSLVLLWPLGGLISIYEGFVNIEQTFDVTGLASWRQHKTMTWLLFIVSTVTSMLAGYRLYKEHAKESVRFAIYAIWLAGPILNLTAIMAGILILGVPYAGGGFWQGFASIVFSVCIASLWTAYLKRSVRVKNTYNLPWYP